MADPTYKDLSQIRDTTNNVIYRIKAKALQDAIAIALTGDVSGSASSDLSSDITISVTIGNKKVTHAMIGDGAVQDGNILDGTITLSKLAASVFGNSDPSSDNDGHIVTHAQLVSYVARLLQGYGQNYGVMTVASINAMTLDNLHNGDLVIVGGISEAVPANVITLGNLTVRNGENLIFHKTGTGASTTGVWQSVDGEFKLIQTATDTDNASGSGKGGTLRTLVRLQQDANGDVTATFSDIQSASTSQKGVVQLSDAVNSTDTDKAATANAVKTVYGLASTKITKVSGATEGNIPVFDANGEVVDSGTKPSDFEPTSDANEVIAAALNEINARLESVEDRKNFGDLVAETVSMQEFPLVGGKSMVLFGSSAPDSAPSYEGQLYLDLTNKNLYFSVGQSSASDWVLAKKKQSAVTLNGSTIKTVTQIAQDANGNMRATFEDIRSASTTQKGVVQLSDSTASASSETAATSAAVKQAYDLAASKQETITWMTDAEALQLWTDAWNAAT